MKKKFKYILLTIVIVLILIQFIPVDRTNPPSDPIAEITAPADVQAILVRSCFDCHSNRTVWPAYSYVAPISWLVASDVKEGRGRFNFSEWQTMPAQTTERLKQDIVAEVREGGMPLPIYLIMHSDAKPTDQQKQILEDWAGAGSINQGQ